MPVFPFQASGFNRLVAGFERFARVALLLLFVATAAPALAAVPVEFRLVPYDDMDGDIDARVAEATAEYHLYPYTLTEGQRERYVPPYDCWARNIRLDNEPLFEIYYKGEYVARRPVARRDSLKVGEHKIWPGNHVFTVDKDGMLKSDSSELVITVETVEDEKSGKEVERQVVRLKAYPVMVRAVNVDPRAPPPLELYYDIPLPELVLRDATFQAAGDVRELQPSPARALWVQCWLPANAVGDGYTLYPLRHTFHLTPDGVTPGPGYAAPGWRHEGFRVVIPVTRILVQGPPASQLKIEEMQFIKFTEHTAEDYANLYVRDEPYILRVSPIGPALRLAGDLTDLPNKVIQVGWSGPEQLEQRCMLIESEARHLAPDRTFRARIRAIDSLPANKAAAAASNAVDAVAAKTSAMKSAETKMKQAQKRLADAEKKIEAARAPYDNAVKKRDALRKQIVDLKANEARAGAMKQTVATAAANLAKMEEALKAARAKVTTATAARAEANRKAAASQGQVDAATKQLTDAREREKALKAASTKAEAGLKAENEKKQKNQAAIDAAAARVDDFGNKLTTVQAEINRMIRSTDAATAQGLAEQKAIKTAEQVLATAKKEAATAAANAERADKEHVRRQGESDAMKIAQIPAELAKAEAALKAQAKAETDAQAAVAGPVKTAQAAFGKLKSAVATATREHKQAVNAHGAAEKVRGRELGLSKKAEEKNPLGKVRLYARLRQRGLPQWVSLPVKQVGGGFMDVTLPSTTVPGVYRLRLGVTPSDPTEAAMFGDQWVTVAGDGGPGIGLFSRRGRDSFYRGEAVRLAVAVLDSKNPVPVGTRISVTLEDRWGDSVMLLDEEISEAIVERRTYLVKLDEEITRSLAPGEYQAVPRIGDVRGPVFKLTLVDPEPETHFLNLLIGKYNNYNGAYSSVIMGGNAISARSRNLGVFPMRSTMSADEVAQSIADSGYNAFMGMDYGMNRVWFPDSEVITRLVRERPELGPWEAFVPGSGRDQFFNALLKRRVDFYENLFTQHDTMMPRGEMFMQACERFTTMEAASMRHHPVFKGVCLYDEFAQSLDHDTPGVVMAHFHKADEANYRRKYAKEKWTSSDASRALDRFTGRSAAQRDRNNLVTHMTWPDHLADQWREFSERMANAAKRVMPDARNFTLARIGALPGDNLGDIAEWEKVFEPLEIASTVGYKDMGGWGDFPVSGPMMADVLRFRDDITVAPMIYGLQTGPYGESNLRHAFFTLSQNVDGISFMQFESVASRADLGDNYDTLRDITKRLTTYYGDLFLAADRGYKKVAIYYSRDADLLSGRKPIKVRMACEGLWVACMHAGYPADFLTDDQILADKALEYEVIIAPGWFYEKEMSEDVQAALTRVVQADKIIAVERDSRIEISGVKRLASNFDEVDDRLGGTFPKYLDFDNERWWNMTRKTSRMLSEFLAQHVEPAAEHDMLVGPDWLRCRDGEYLVVANHAFTGFTGNHKTLFQAPSMPTLRFPRRPPACYDMLAMRPIEVADDGTNMSLKADMRFVPGRIYAFLPSAIEGVQVQGASRAEGGVDWHYAVSVVDASGEGIDAGFPIELTIANAAGDELQHVYRAADPVYHGVYRVPVNGVADGMTLRVRELISGRETTVQVDVSGGGLPGGGLIDEDIFISDSDRIRNFLAEAPSLVGFEFKPVEVHNMRRLVRRFQKATDVLTTYLRDEAFAAETREMIMSYNRRKSVSSELAAAMLDELNKVVNGDYLFTDERFPPGSLRIETGRIAGLAKGDEEVRDLNRLLLEETYADAITRREPLLVVVEESWARPEAERLGRWLTEQGVRTRVGPAQPWIRQPGPMFGFEDNELVGLDGSRLWRGHLVRPGTFLDCPVIIVGGRRGLVSRLIERDLLSDPVSENFPGRGRAVMGWTPEAFSIEYNTVHVLSMDQEGLRKGIDTLLNMDGIEDTLLARASFKRSVPRTDMPAEVLPGKAVERATPMKDEMSSTDRVTVMAVHPTDGRVAAGTFGYGKNLFCMSATGEMLWNAFLPEHEVYHLEWIDNGKRLLAATAHGWRVFILDGSDGRVIRAFASSEWPHLHVGEREFATRIKLVTNPPMRQILALGSTGIMSVDYDGKKMWFYDRLSRIVDIPKEARMQGFASFGKYADLLQALPSPNGQKIAYNEFRYFASTWGFNKSIVPLWRNEPQILDARTGKVLLYNKSDPGSSDKWTLSWEPNSSHAWIHASNFSAPLRNGAQGPGGVFLGEVGTHVPVQHPPLAGGGYFHKDFHFVERFALTGEQVWDYVDRTDFWIVDLDPLSPDEGRMFRSGRNGWVLALDMKTGKKIWNHKLPYRALLTPLADNGVLVGTRNGFLQRFDASGKTKWKVALREHNEVPEADYEAYIAQERRGIPDATAEFYRVSREQPDDFKGVLRMGIEQLDNGAFENGNAWQASTGTVTVAAPAKAGAKALVLSAGDRVTTHVNRRVIHHATYLLEFWYQPEHETNVLTAGAALEGKADGTTFTLSNFRGEAGKWTFGRIAVKTHADTTSFSIGFEATGGRVRVDQASLRPVRFPSANLVANDAVHRIVPSHPRDFRNIYNRVPHVIKEDLMSENHVRALMQSTPLGALVFAQEHAFLHNGRLDDIGHMWSFRPNPIGFTVVLNQERWVSHVVLYLNNSSPDKVYRTMSIVANDCLDPEEKYPRTVGYVRGNLRRFVVVHFKDPVLTDNIKILPGHQRTWQDNLTEVEIYGPVGGPGSLAKRGFAPDPLATAMFMGNASHVPATLPEDFVGTYKSKRALGIHLAPAIHCGVTVVNELMAMGQAAARLNRQGDWGETALVQPFPVTAQRQQALAAQQAASRKLKRRPFLGWHAGTVTPISTPARYSGRLIVGCADYKVHAVADNGVQMWEFATGGRVYSSPTPDGDEVYFGSDDGRLYKIDIDSGMLIWEMKTGGRIRSAPAVDKTRIYVVSWDGHVYAVDKRLGKVVWKTKIAPDSSGSPALANGRIYVGDDAGAVHVLNASNGKKVGGAELGEAIATCPVVTPDGTVFVGERGKGLLLKPDLTVGWTKDLLVSARKEGEAPLRLTGQPSATKTQVLVPSNKGLLVVKRADGTLDTRFVPPRKGNVVIAAVAYGNRLCVIENRTAVHGGKGNWIVANLGAGEVWEKQ
jgi:outer membrane protein assembly factor BamB